MDNKQPLPNAPAPESLARVVRWAVLIFLAYALLTGSFHFRGPEQPKPPENVTGSVAMKETQPNRDCGTEGGLDNFSMLAAALMPTRVPEIRIEDIKKGEGAALVCGQNVGLRIEYALQDGTVIYSTMDSNDSTRVTIGDGKLLKGVESGIMGMRKGGERKITFPYTLAFGAMRDPSRLLGWEQIAPKMNKIRTSIIMARVSLVEFSSSLPTSSMQLRVIDHKFSGGLMAQCGDKVGVDITLWKVDGTKIFSTLDTKTPLVFTLGLSEVPFGIEQSVMGMSEKSQRTIILPAAYVRPLVVSEGSTPGNALAQLPIPEETMLAEVRLVHIGDDLRSAAPVKHEAPGSQKPEAKHDSDKKPTPHTIGKKKKHDDDEPN